MLLASIAPAHFLTDAVSSASDFIVCQHDPASLPESHAPPHRSDHCPPCTLGSPAGTLLALTWWSWLVPTTITSFIPAKTTAKFVPAKRLTPKLSQGPPDSA
jgi:hypothetical protein